MDKVTFQLIIIIDGEEYRCVKEEVTADEKKELIQTFYNNINKFDKMKYTLENGSVIILNENMIKKSILIVK